MSDDEEGGDGGEDPWAGSAMGVGGEDDYGEVARAEDDDGFELLEETKFDPRLHKPGAMIMAAPRGPQARNTKRNAEAQIKAAAQAKHSRVEADQLFPWRDDHPQDPRIMGVDYVVVNEVTYFCNVNLWVLLYRQAQTGQPVM